MRLWGDGWINPEIDCRITPVILGGVRVRTATSSLFPSVISLADKLLWLFQPGCITLYSTFLYHSVQFNVEKGRKKKRSKAKLKTVALCACSLRAEVITKWQEVAFFWFQGDGCVWGGLGVGAVMVGEEGVALSAEEQVIAGTCTAKKNPLVSLCSKGFAVGSIFLCRKTLIRFWRCAAVRVLPGPSQTHQWLCQEAGPMILKSSCCTYTTLE